MAIGAHAALLVAVSVPLRFEDVRTVADDEPPAWWAEEPATRVALAPHARSAASRPVRRPSPAAEGVTDPLAAEAGEPAPSPLDAPAARPLAMLDDDARPRLPYEPLFAASPPPREGDFHTPGDGSEDDVFYRPLALEPNATRFAKAWRPTQTLGGEWLERLMEVTSGEVSIPLNDKFNLVCGGTLLGLGGGCLIVRDGGSDVIVQRPPPAPWERANRVQCRELREQLAVAEDVERVAFLLDRLNALCVEP